MQLQFHAVKSHGDGFAPDLCAPGRHTGFIPQDLPAVVEKHHFADGIISFFPLLTEFGRTVVACFHEQQIASFLKEGGQIIGGTHIA